MRNASNLFKKIGDIKGTFHERTGTRKHRNGPYGPNRSRRDLRRGGKDIQKSYTRKVLMTWKTTMVWSLT